MDRRVGWCRACACCGCPLSVYRSSVCVFYDNCHACHHSDGGHSRSRHSMVPCLASCAIHRQGTREAVMDTWDCKKETARLVTWISIRAKKTGPEVARAPRRAAIPPQAARGDLGSRGRGAHAACWPQPRAVAPRAAHHGPLPALPRLAAKVIAASATRGAAPPPDLRTRQITFFCAASCATLPLELVGAARRTARGRVNAAQVLQQAGLCGLAACALLRVPCARSAPKHAHARVSSP